MAERLTRPKGYLTKGKTKSPDAARKAKARETFTPKGLGKTVLNAVLSGSPIGRGAKAASAAVKVVSQAEKKAISLSSARTKANIDKMEKSGKYKKTGNAKPSKPVAKSQPAKPTKEQALQANRTRDLRAAKYRGSLSKEPKPLSKTPRLSNETKKLLEKFQTPKEQPPSTRTGMGGMIGEARPAAAGAKRERIRQEQLKRPITRSKKNPKEIKEERIEKAIAAKKARFNAIASLKKPVKPARSKTKQNLTKSNRSGKYNKRAEELDLSTDKNIQTVRGKEYPDGFPMKSRFAGKTIESRTSQNPNTRGKNVKQVDESRKRKEDVREKEIDKEVEARANEGMKTYFPKANPNKRLPRKTLEDRRVQLKKQARSKRAAASTAKAKYDKLTPAQRVRVKRILKEKQV